MVPHFGRNSGKNMAKFGALLILSPDKASAGGSQQQTQKQEFAMFIQPNFAFETATKLDALAGIPLDAQARSGLVQGTRVEAADGWRPVETLGRGDAVYTLDGGLKEIREIRRQQVTPGRSLRVPGGALDNCADMTVLAGQHLLLENAHVEASFGAPMALIPAAALAGYRDITWALARESVEVVTLVFQEEEIVWANTGVLMHCPDVAQAAQRALKSRFFTLLDRVQARALVSLMAADARHGAEACAAA